MYWGESSDRLEIGPLVPQSGAMSAGIAPGAPATNMNYHGIVPFLFQNTGHLYEDTKTDSQSAYRSVSGHY